MVARAECDVPAFFPSVNVQTTDSDVVGFIPFSNYDSDYVRCYLLLCLWCRVSQSTSQRTNRPINSTLTGPRHSHHAAHHHRPTGARTGSSWGPTSSWW